MCGWCEFLHVSGYLAANNYDKDNKNWALGTLGQFHPPKVGKKAKCDSENLQNSHFCCIFVLFGPFHIPGNYRSVPKDPFYSMHSLLLLPKTNNYDTFIAAVELRGSKQLIPIVGGAISGGVLIIVIVLVLIIIIIVVVKYKTRHEIKPDAMGE